MNEPTLHNMSFEEIDVIPHQNAVFVQFLVPTEGVAMGRGVGNTVIYMPGHTYRATINRRAYTGRNVVLFMRDGEAGLVRIAGNVVQEQLLIAPVLGPTIPKDIIFKNVHTY